MDGEPGGLQSMGSLTVDWVTSLFTFMHWRRKWQPTPVFLPGESRGWGAWWAAVYGVTQSWTWLKRLSSSSIFIPRWCSGKESACQCRRIETWVWSLGREDPLEEGIVTHSSILAWRIPWTEEPSGLQSIGLWRVGYDLAAEQQLYLGRGEREFQVITWPILLHDLNILSPTPLSFLGEGRGTGGCGHQEVVEDECGGGGVMGTPVQQGQLT